MKEKLLQYLAEEPRARERKNKDRAIINLLLKEYPTFAIIPKEDLIELCRAFNSTDRLWRLALMENEGLRGTDYNDKAVLEQEKVIQLGYEIGNRVPKL